MIKLNTKRVQEELAKIKGASILHTATSTIISRGDYTIYIDNPKKNEKALTHKMLWNEDKNGYPMCPAHLVFRYQVSKALGAADE